MRTLLVVALALLAACEQTTAPGPFIYLAVTAP
jgi:hypothetical protein